MSAINYYFNLQKLNSSFKLTFRIKGEKLLALFKKLSCVLAGKENETTHLAGYFLPHAANTNVESLKKKSKRNFLHTLQIILFIMMGAVHHLNAQVVTTINTSGTFTVPAGVTSLTVEAWGTGGSGGGVALGLTSRGGGGGGGGAYATSNIAASGGQVYTVTIGATGATGTGAGGAGGATIFTGPGGNVTANGGSGGAPNNGVGGAGGLGFFNGGGGGTGNASNGAGGGGGAGNAGVGGLGATAAAGIGGPGLPNVAPYVGGDGGANKTGTGTGNPGIVPGGGGGGGRATILGTANGGVGGTGRVVITYTILACSGTPAPGNTISSANTVCPGINFTLSLQNATIGTGVTYQWQSADDAAFTLNVVNLGTAVTQVTNLAASKYYHCIVTCANNPTPGISNPVLVTMNPSPVINVLPANGTICNPGGIAIPVTASGANTYTWNPIAGLTPNLGAIVSANPVSTTTYTVTGTAANGCTATNTVTINVGNVPVVNAISASPSSICSGATSSLSASAIPVSTYQWAPAIAGVIANPNQQTTNANPPVTTIYTVTATSLIGCTATSTVTVSILPVVTGIASVTPSPVCLGATSIFTGSVPLSCAGGNVLGFATGYAPVTWTFTQSNSNGTVNPAGAPLNIIMTSGNNLSGTPGTTNYAHTIGCAGTLSFNWNYVHADAFGSVFDYPRYTINGGAPITLTGFVVGGSNIQNGTESIIVAAGDILQLQAYTIDNDPLSCSITITNFSAPTPPLGGTVSYWDAAVGGNNVGAPPITTTPLVAGTVTYYAEYTALGSGCVNPVRDVVSLIVNSNPVVSAGANPATICLGASSVLSGGGAVSYAWNPGALVGSPSVSPVATTTYSVTGTDANGCTATSTVDVVVNTLPAVTASASPSTICIGGSSTLSGSGANSYAWDPGALTGNPAVSPLATTNYTVTGTDANGCTATSIVDVVVNNLPPVTASASPSAICIGASSTLTGGGANTYAWDPGALVGNPAVSPLATTTYTVTGTDANGCTATSTVDIVVNNLPVVTASSSPSAICVGESSTLSGSGAASYAWDPGALVGNPAVSPLVTTSYTVTGTDANGCTGTSTADVVVNSLPIVTASPVTQTVCENEMATVTGSGATSYAWTGGILDATPFMVIAAATYTVTGTDGNGCSNTATAEILMNAAPVIVASATPNTTCNQTTVTPTATGAATYVWTAPLLNGVPFVAVATATYTVTGTDGAGCTASTTLLVTVNPVSGTLASSTSNQTQNHDDDFNINYYAANCDLILSVDDGAGGNILGLTTSTVNVDAAAGTHNGQPFVRRWYQITPTNNGSANVVLYINQSDFDDYNGTVALPYLPLPTSGNNADPNIPNIRITKNDDAGLGNNPIVITPTVNWNGTYWELSFNTPSFSQFRVHSVNPGNVPLPATITNFSGIKLEASDKLSWTTSSEQNNAYFNLQHSTDGTNFTTIAKVNSKAQSGNSASALNYSTLNPKPSSGHNYYRLQQSDLDNKLSVHAQIVDLIWGANGSTVSIYPNPATDVLNIDLYAPSAQNTTVKLLDMSGRVIKQIQAKSVVGINNIKLSMGEIASGLYTIQVYENGKLSHMSKVESRK